MDMDERSRDVLFFTACVPARFLAYRLARDASINDRENVKVFGRVAAGAASLYWAIMSELPLKNETGFFGGPVWWDSARPIHAGLYSYYAFTGDYRSLFVDIIFGLCVWMAKKSNLEIFAN
jgi:hypothetical protein